MVGVRRRLLIGVRCSSDKVCECTTSLARRFEDFNDVVGIREGLVPHAQLKQECGGAFTSKLEGMVKDIGLSVELTASFRETARRQSDSAVDLNAAVLTVSNWPTYTPVEITLPAEIVRLHELFSGFYCAKHANRKLTWENSLGHCLIGGRFPKGNKDLQMSIYQGAVLLNFNESETATFKEIQQAIKIDHPTLMRVLQSLACAKVRVLAKAPN